MGEIYLLDCTLRDGGYINDWDFGEDVLSGILAGVERTGVEVMELGFLKNEPHKEGRAVFNTMAQVKEFIKKKKSGLQYAVMSELVNPVPLDRLERADGGGADIIRMILWKTKRLPDGRVVDALDEGYEYCRGIVERGYRLCVQPVRVNQYSDEEFITIIRRFSVLEPMAFYVVDSWGTQNGEGVLHYMRLADQHLPEKTVLGYHGHNNMMQALSVSQAALKEGFKRTLMIDASVYGIGRGAGNLNLELIAKYLNEQYGKHYDLTAMLEIYEKYIKEIYRRETWGYSIPYFLTASYNCNPNYARYLGSELKLEADCIRYVLTHLPPEGRIIYSKSEADFYIKEYCGGKWPVFGQLQHFFS